MSRRVPSVSPLPVADATHNPKAGHDRTPGRRRYDAVVAALHWGLRVYLLVGLVVLFFWNGPGPGFGPVADAVFRVLYASVVVVIGLLGLGFVFTAAAGLVTMTRLTARGHRAAAAVVAGDGPPDEPRFRFTDEDGREHTVGRPVSRVGGPPVDGQEVTVLYLPERPETFVVDRFADKWGAVLAVVLLGLVLVAAAAVTAAAGFP
jgi:hypothetical protein